MQVHPQNDPTQIYSRPDHQPTTKSEPRQPEKARPASHQKQTRSTSRGSPPVDTDEQTGPGCTASTRQKRVKREPEPRNGRNGDSGQRGQDGHSRQPRADNGTREPALQRIDAQAITPAVCGQFRDLSARVADLNENLPPDIRQQTANFIRDVLKQQIGLDIDPDKTWVNRFNGAEALHDGNDGITGWQHTGRDLQEAKTLTAFVLENFSDAWRGAETSNDLNMHFGVYKEDSGADVYGGNNEIRLRPSKLKELIGHGDLEKYLDRKQASFWSSQGSRWRALAKTEFASLARKAMHDGQLTQAGYRLAMKGAAPDLPLESAAPLAKMRNETSPDPSVRTGYLDIDGYTATDILRFSAQDGRQVLYLPGHANAFHEFDNEARLKDWVIDQARDPAARRELASHFSIYDRSRGGWLSYAGVDEALDNLASGKWRQDSVDTRANTVHGDVFTDMAARTKQRNSDDLRQIVGSGDKRNMWLDDLRQPNASPLTRPIARVLQAGNLAALVGAEGAAALTAGSNQTRAAGIDTALALLFAPAALSSASAPPAPSAPPSADAQPDTQKQFEAFEFPPQNATDAYNEIRDAMERITGPRNLQQYSSLDEVGKSADSAADKLRYQRVKNAFENVYQTLNAAYERLNNAAYKQQIVNGLKQSLNTTDDSALTQAYDRLRSLSSDALRRFRIARDAGYNNVTFFERRDKDLPLPDREQNSRTSAFVNLKDRSRIIVNLEGPDSNVHKLSDTEAAKTANTDLADAVMKQLMRISGNAQDFVDVVKQQTSDGSASAAKTVLDLFVLGEPGDALCRRVLGHAPGYPDDRTVQDILGVPHDHPVNDHMRQNAKHLYNGMPASERKKFDASIAWTYGSEERRNVAQTIRRDHVLRADLMTSNADTAALFLRQIAAQPALPAGRELGSAGTNSSRTSAFAKNKGGDALASTAKSYSPFNQSSVTGDRTGKLSTGVAIEAVTRVDQTGGTLRAAVKDIRTDLTTSGPAAQRTLDNVKGHRNNPDAAVLTNYRREATRQYESDRSASIAALTRDTAQLKSRDIAVVQMGIQDKKGRNQADGPVLVEQRMKGDAYQIFDPNNGVFTYANADAANAALAKYVDTAFANKGNLYPGAFTAYEYRPQPGAAKVAPQSGNEASAAQSPAAPAANAVAAGDTRVGVLYDLSAAVVSDMPDVAKIARERAAQRLYERTGEHLDPDNTWLHGFRFSESSPTSFNGWEHRDAPRYSLTLTQAWMNNFDASWQDQTPNDVNALTGIYRDGPGKKLYGANNEVRYLASDLRNDIWKDNLQATVSDAQARFWSNQRQNWIALAKAEFIGQARKAHQAGSLTASGYELAMKGAAPDVALEAPVTVDQLRHRAAPDASVQVRQFDINGLTSSDIRRFVGNDGRQVLYLPGEARPFHEFSDEAALKHWVIEQAKDPQARDALAKHFSLYDRQNGVTATGVDEGLRKLAAGQWDGSAIDSRSNDKETAIGRDVFDEMADRAKARDASDADTLVKSDGEVRADMWKNYLTAANSTVGIAAVVAGPIGGVIATGAFGAQLGWEGYQSGTGDTEQERQAALRDLGSDIATSLLFGGLTHTGGAHLVADATQSAKPWFRFKLDDGRIGYPMGPTRPPKAPRTENEEAPQPQQPASPLPAGLDLDAPVSPRLQQALAQIQRELDAIRPAQLADDDNQVVKWMTTHLSEEEIERLANLPDDKQFEEEYEKIYQRAMQDIEQSRTQAGTLPESGTVAATTEPGSPQPGPSGIRTQPSQTAPRSESVAWLDEAGAPPAPLPESYPEPAADTFRDVGDLNAVELRPPHPGGMAQATEALYRPAYRQNSVTSKMIANDAGDQTGCLGLGMLVTRMAAAKPEQMNLLSASNVVAGRYMQGGAARQQVLASIDQIQTEEWSRTEHGGHTDGTGPREIPGYQRQLGYASTDGRQLARALQLGFNPQTNRFGATPRFAMLSYTFGDNIVRNLNVGHVGFVQRAFAHPDYLQDSYTYYDSSRGAYSYANFAQLARALNDYYGVAYPELGGFSGANTFFYSRWPAEAEQAASPHAQPSGSQTQPVPTASSSEPFWSSSTGGGVPPAPLPASYAEPPADALRDTGALGTSGWRATEPQVPAEAADALYRPAQQLNGVTSNVIVDGAGNRTGSLGLGMMIARMAAAKPEQLDLLSASNLLATGYREGGVRQQRILGAIDRIQTEERERVQGGRSAGVGPRDIPYYQRQPGYSSTDGRQLAQALQLGFDPQTNRFGETPRFAMLSYALGDNATHVGFVQRAFANADYLQDTYTYYDASRGGFSYPGFAELARALSEYYGAAQAEPGGFRGVNTYFYSRKRPG